MKVKELIIELEKLENKELEVILPVFDFGYDFCPAVKIKEKRRELDDGEIKTEICICH